MQSKISLVVTTLKILSVLLFISSVSYFIKSIIEITTLGNAKLDITNIYYKVSKYSGLYKFTFVAFAFWVTLRQLEISQKNYSNTLKQIKFTQEDIERKRKKESSTETLKQCNFYLQEMQIAYKELFEIGAMNGLLVEWHLLKNVTKGELQEKYDTFHTKIENSERDIKNKTLTVLYKFEAFSSFFLHGDLDKRLGKQIIGYTYTRQVFSLLGLISYFRDSEKSVFGKHTISLYREWLQELTLDIQ